MPHIGSRGGHIRALKISLERTRLKEKFQEVEPLHALAEEQIKQAGLTRQRALGRTVPTEWQMAKIFGVSRVVVREVTHTRSGPDHPKEGWAKGWVVRVFAKCTLSEIVYLQHVLSGAGVVC